MCLPGASPAGPLGRRPSKGSLPQHAVQLHLGADVQRLGVRLLHGGPGREQRRAGRGRKHDVRVPSPDGVEPN